MTDYRADGFNRISITDTAATALALLDVHPEGGMSAPLEPVLRRAESEFEGENCDRVFMYNPDAIAMWIYEKYRLYFQELEKRANMNMPVLTVYPPVTPVCFASMYSGLLPDKHGIQKYEKPILRVKTVFDRLIESRRRAAIVSTKGDSISKIFLDRDMDYFIYPTKQQCNDKALELIREDRYELIVLYNGDYDHYMHRHTPEGTRALRALQENIATYNQIYDAVTENWGYHNSVVAFAPDHGCHREFGFLGNHGKDEPCDRNIMHFYGFIPRTYEMNGEKRNGTGSQSGRNI